MLDHVGGTLALCVMAIGIVLGYFVLKPVFGPEGGVFVGLLLAAYPAYLVFKKIEF